jgi:acetylornithine deacetylase/succinyl-diaminopimelate desuccinylase-like protein
VPALLDDLLEWLRIPSVSTGGGDPEALEQAATWAAERVREAGGTCDLVRRPGANPIVVGELRAADDHAPTILIYGHYDVQGAEEPELWTTPAFEPDVRDGRVFARGAADDKGNFLPLLRAACDLARAGELPVHVRVVVEGDEEIGSGGVIGWLEEDDRGADAALVFDSGMADAQTPAITLGLRGIVQLSFTVRTAGRDLHSGMFGGAALNALHVVHRLLAEVAPDASGRVREELWRDVRAPSPAELESWKRLPAGDGVLRDAGARPVAPDAGEAFWVRTTGGPSLDVNEVRGGAPRTVIPREAQATISLRLAPGQDPATMEGVLKDLLTAALPEGAEVEWAEAHSAPAALFGPEEPVIRLAADAIGRAAGVEPVLMRSGGSIPIVAALAAKGIPTVVTGFVLPDDPFHAPDESFSLRGLELGERAGRELLLALGALRAGA